MKKNLLFIIPILLILIIVIYLVFFNEKENIFFLETRYYGSSNITEIELDELNELIDKKESFGIFIYQPSCVTSSDFEQVLYDFQEQNLISFYKIPFSKVKDELDFLNYYPSFIIYKKGKVIDFLEADKDEDIEYYKSSEGFKKWFTKYAEIKEDINNSSNNNSSDIDQDNIENSNTDDNEFEDIKIELDNVVQEENKVNIYFFWGDGCPHCEEEMAFFESIEKEYGKYYNLYKFETWNDEENAKIFNIFANAMGDEARAVPYTIIGEKSFFGFGENSKEQFINAIEEQSKNNYDVYFDKLKK